MIILLAGIFLTALPAAAQLYRAQPHPVPQKAKPAQPDEAEQTMQKFSKCLLRTPSLEGSVLRYLQLPSYDPEQGKRGSALTKSGCVPAGTSRMRFMPDLFRYSLFSELYRKHFGTEKPGNLDQKEQLDFSAEFNQTRAPVSTMELAVRKFGDCVARRNSIESHTLLLTEIHGDSERGAIAKIMPDLSACLSEGVELKFSRTVIRGILAEAMYKLRFASDNPQMLEAIN